MRALLSVDDKAGLITFARGLQELGWELIATDGTRAALAAEGVTARSVEDLTGSPSLLDGRVKTLHPRIHAALLARRSNETHTRETNPPPGGSRSRGPSRSTSSPRTSIRSVRPLRPG